MKIDAYYVLNMYNGMRNMLPYISKGIFLSRI